MRRGFSLMEILITAVVIALALVPLVLSLKTSTRSVTGTREYLSAVAFAQRTLEELRRAAFHPPRQQNLPPGALPTIDEMAAAMAANQPLDATGRGNALTENGVTYTRRIKLVPERYQDLSAGMPELRVVQIEIAWKPISAGLLAAENRYQVASLLGSTNQP